MKRIKPFTVFLAAVLLLGGIGFTPMTASAADAVWNGAAPSVSGGDTVTIMQGASGTLNVPSGIVIIEGEVPDVSTAITLNISPGAEVVWKASYTGEVNPLKSSMVAVTGGGKLTIDSGVIGNTGTGCAIGVTGADSAVTVSNHSVVYSGRSGNAIRVSADRVKIDVESGSHVDSLDGDENAAIQIESRDVFGIKGVIITIDGGFVGSENQGYAIFDGAGFVDGCENDTEIIINGGEVRSDKACAVRSTGRYSTITVNGGIISDGAGNNSNPAIYMSASADSETVNVTINGGKVEARLDTGNAFAIQTAGSIEVNGGLVTAKNGRAINITGVKSVATVTGGTVEVTGGGASSTAISTATTANVNVTDSKIKVTGGTVQAAGGGTAIRITGANSEAIVSGGEIKAASGYAIYADSDSAGANANFIISVSGDAMVSSQTGTAIRNNGGGPGANVTIDGACQVWVMNEGYAINSNSAVTLNGGFVFALGDAETVIYGNASASAGSTTIVAAWDKAQTTGKYYGKNIPGMSAASSYQEHLDVKDCGNGANINNVWWYKHPELGGCIHYAKDGMLGFFPLPVTVFQKVGLHFDPNLSDIDPVNGLDGIDDITHFNPLPNNQSFDAPPTWNLENFAWNTENEVSLLINNDEYLEILLNGTNMFSGAEYGIIINPGGSLSLSGDSSGSLIARGGESAISIGSGGSLDLPSAYIYWTSDNLEPDPDDPGRIFTGAAPYDVPYTHDPGHKYVKISIVPFAVVSDGVTGTVGTDLGGEAVDITVYNADVDLLSNVSASDWFAYLPAGVSVEAAAGIHTITLTFTGTPGEVSNARFDITIPANVTDFGSPINVISEPGAVFDIVPDPSVTEYNLIILASEGGTVTGYESQRYPVGNEIEETATADPGYRFIGWTANGVDIDLSVSLLSFYMPRNAVMLTANFEPIEYTVTLNQASGGTAAASHSTATIKDTVTLEVSFLNPAYGFVRWDVSPAVTWTSGSAASRVAAFQMPAENVTVTPVYLYSGYIGGGGGTPSPPAGDPETPGPAPKLTEDHIRYLNGYPDFSVRPDNNITRAEAAAIFYRLIDDENKETPLTATFSDVSAGAWYYQAVAYLQKYNIITGYPDGTFAPDQAITRAEFAAIASRFDTLEFGVPNNFNDVPGSHWAIDYINSAASKGWISGFPDGSFMPDDNITRAQVVTIVNRMLNRKIELADIPEDVPEYNDIDPSHWAYCDIIEASFGHTFTRKENGFEIWESWER